MSDVKKATPSQCKYRKCHWNEWAPPENSQECIACDGLKKEDWTPEGRVEARHV